jgi:hypothetical protein
MLISAEMKFSDAAFSQSFTFAGGYYVTGNTW